MGDLILRATGKVEFPQAKDIQGYFQSEPEYAAFYQTLARTPNGRFFATRLTVLGAESDHASVKVVLDPKGANFASLVGKPVHFTKDLRGHFGLDTDGKAAPLTFGVTLGGRIHPADAEGSIPLDTFGLLWADDYPAPIGELVLKADEMGSSWEIKFDREKVEVLAEPDWSKPDPRGTIKINAYSFGGIALLYRSAAAYPQSQILVAGKDGEQEALDLATLFSKSKGAGTSNLPPAEDPPSASSPNEPPAQAAKPRARRHYVSRIQANRAGSSLPGKENGMSLKFCADCDKEFQAALQGGEILLRVEAEAQEEIRAKDAAVAEAKKLADAAEKRAEAAEKALQDRIAADEAHDAEVRAQNDAIKDWETASAKFPEKMRDKIRQPFIEARKKINLKASAEEVEAGYKELLALQDKFAGQSGRPKPFDAFEGTGRVVIKAGNASQGGQGEENPWAGYVPPEILEKWSTENTKAFFAVQGKAPSSSRRNADNGSYRAEE